MKINHTIFVLSLVAWAMARILLSVVSLMLWQTFHHVNALKLFMNISIIDFIVGITSIISCLLFMYFKSKVMRNLTGISFILSAITTTYIIYRHYIGPYKHGYEGIGQTIALILLLILQAWIYIAVTNKVKIK